MRSRTGQVSELAVCKAHNVPPGPAYLLPNLADFAVNLGVPTYVECWVHAVSFISDEVQWYGLVLKDIDDKSDLLVPIGYPEACAIYHEMKNSPYPTPPTHQLTATLVKTLGGSLIEAVVEGFNSQTQAYKCRLAVGTANGVVSITCRVSDAAALSLYMPLPIRVHSALMARKLRAEPP